MTQPSARSTSRHLSSVTSGTSGRDRAGWKDSSRMNVVHGCEHYVRRCKLVAPCCGEIFWCRHCHNAAKHDEQPDENLRHVLDRKAVTEVVCSVCHVRQPVRRDCVNCGTVFGRYFCPECKFFDDATEKDQFHCDGCGICRVGGRQNFFHCDTCNCCYHVSMQDDHVCVRNSMHSNCPICQEFLFDSVREISVMACGHTIHESCWKQLLKYEMHKCPVCARSIGDMTRKWRQMDLMIAAAPMPAEYRNRSVSILCNDCNRNCVVQDHAYGHKCTTCGGYNTVPCHYISNENR